MKECTCGTNKGPITINKIHEDLTILECSWCGGEIGRWETVKPKAIIGKPRELTEEERLELR
jgi:hypothetical protein